MRGDGLGPEQSPVVRRALLRALESSSSDGPSGSRSQDMAELSSDPARHAAVFGPYPPRPRIGWRRDRCHVVRPAGGPAPVVGRTPARIPDDSGTGRLYLRLDGPTEAGLHHDEGT